MALCDNRNSVADTLRSATVPSSPLSLAEVVAAIRVQEHAIHDLHILNFRGKVMKRTGSDWAETPVGVEGDAWYDGSFEGRCRVDGRARVVLRDDPNDPLWQTNDILSYDGRVGLRIVNFFKTNGVSHYSRQAVILREAPVQLWNGMQPYTDGSGFTLGFVKSFLEVDGVAVQRLGDVLSALASSRHPPTLTNEVLDGKPTVSIQDLVGDRYSFDPNLGFSLVAATEGGSEDGRHAVERRSLRVLRFTEAAKGIWYPTAGYFEYRDLGSEGTQRISFTVERAVANDPKFADTVFRPVIPRGYFVRDEAARTSFVSDGDVNSLSNAIDDAAKKARDVSPATMPSGVSPHVPREADPGASRNPWAAVWKLALIIAAACGVLVWHLRRRGPLASLLLPLLSVTCFSALARSPVCAGQVLGNGQRGAPQTTEVHANSAVDSCYFLARYFNRDVKITGVISDLRAGDQCDRACSIYELKSAVELNGLIVRFKKLRFLRDALAPLSTGTAVVARQARAGLADRFVVLTPCGEGWMATDAAAVHRQQVVSVGQLEGLLPDATGEVLLVSEPPPWIGRPHVAALATEIDLGDVPSDAAPILVQIPIVNVGTEPALINSVRPSCGCLGKPVFEPQIDGRQPSRIRLTLDPKLLPNGQVERQVLIVTNNTDGANILIDSTSP